MWLRERCGRRASFEGRCYPPILGALSAWRVAAARWVDHTSRVAREPAARSSLSVTRATEVILLESSRLLLWDWDMVMETSQEVMGPTSPWSTSL